MWPFKKKTDGKIDITKDYDPKKNDGKFQKLKSKYMPTKTYLIEMDLRNGDSTEFTKTINTDSFKYLGGEYIIDTTMKKWCASAKLYKLRYHQDCSIAVDQKYDVVKLKSGIKLSNAVWSWMSLNPSVLDTFTDAKLAEQAMKGQKIDEFLKSLNWKIIVILICSALTFLLLIQMSGMLKGLSGAMPF